MIPFRYRLRASVRIEPAPDRTAIPAAVIASGTLAGAAADAMPPHAPHESPGGSFHVVCEAPLTVLTVNREAARLLARLQDAATPADIAGGSAAAEERMFALCEYFRERGILELCPAAVTSGAEVPSVTVIVPTQDRAADLEACLRALDALDYPRGRFEVIVVDDGSQDPGAVATVVARHTAQLIVSECNHGASYSRNRAAREASGEIVAFIDSDCVAEPAWLRELVPYFAWDGVAAVGGRTRGFYTTSRLDRYEEVSSSLDMGRHARVEGRGRGTFYVPTCNLLVRRSVYQALGGLREDLSVGEDVDFCWRLRAGGARIVYVPHGVVRHKHRNRLAAFVRRRFQYGTSEATLHRLHADKRKRFPLAAAPLATTAALTAAVVALEPRLLPLCVLPLLFDGFRRSLRLRRDGVRVSAANVWRSVLRGHLSMVYFVYFHLVRYYLALLFAAGFAARGIWPLAAAAAVYASLVDYGVRRPRLSYPVYLAYYLLEHGAYQAGVFAGCVRARSFRSYIPAVGRVRSIAAPPARTTGGQGGGARRQRLGAVETGPDGVRGLSDRRVAEEAV